MTDLTHLRAKLADETRLDRLIRYGERAKHYQRLAVPANKRLAYVLLAAWYVGFMLSLWMQWLFSLVSLVLVLFVVGMWTGWYGSKMLWWEERYRWLRHELFDEIPISVQIRGHGLYGYDLDADISIVECHECHLPGDCPICGAE